MIDQVALALMLLACLAGGDQAPAKATLDIVAAKKGLVGTLSVERTKDAVILTQGSGENARQLRFAVDPGSPQTYVGAVGGQQVRIDMAPLLKALRPLKDAPKQTLTYPVGDETVTIQLAAAGQVVYVTAADRDEVLVRR